MSGVVQDDDLIECDTHGSTRPVFACRHVARGVACGFWTADDEEEARPSAWCDACEEIANANGGWPDDYAKQHISLLCTHCWDDAQARNTTVPPKARGAKARLTDAEQHDLIHHAVHELQAKQDRAEERWRIGLGGKATNYLRWQTDLDARTLTFLEGDVPRVITDVRIVGTYASSSSTFQWYWRTLERRSDPLVRGMPDLEYFGTVRGIERLTRIWWECDQQEGWEMTALAAYLLGGEAAYRAPGREGMFTFMLLDNFRAVS